MFKNYFPLWGTAKATMFVVALPIDQVKALLPPDVELSSQNITPEGTHPVIFQYNVQKIRILLPFFCMNYDEYIPLIPWVHFKNNPSVNYQMSPILYVSSRLIVIGARIVWHLNKVFAKFKRTNKTNSFNLQIFRKDIKTVTQDVENQGNWNKPSAFPNIETLMPLLTTQAIINDPNNNYWTANYIFEMQDAQPASVQTLLAMPELPNISKLSAESIEKSVLGGFNTNFKWKLKWPKKYNPK